MTAMHTHIQRSAAATTVEQWHAVVVWRVTPEGMPAIRRWLGEAGVTSASVRCEVSARGIRMSLEYTGIGGSGAVGSTGERVLLELGPSEFSMSVDHDRVSVDAPGGVVLSWVVERSDAEEPEWGAPRVLLYARTVAPRLLGMRSFCLERPGLG